MAAVLQAGAFRIRISRPGTRPSGRTFHRGLPHIKRRAEIQKPERGEEHRLGHPDAPAFQHGGREHPQNHESGVQNIHAADNPGTPVLGSIGLDRGKQRHHEKAAGAGETRNIAGDADTGH
jgi:hypothetical protein